MSCPPGTSFQRLNVKLQQGGQTTILACVF